MIFLCITAYVHVWTIGTEMSATYKYSDNVDKANFVTLMW